MTSEGRRMTGPILVTGTTGQLVTCLARQGGAGVMSIGRPELDFDAPETIKAVLARHAPRLIVNAAAYTAVDKAESDPEAADRANHLAPAHIAAYCAQAGIPLIHVSTDYVFDGAKGAPYVETDPTSPTGVYGRTKRDGETAVLDSGAQALILRTSWVYASHGKNFVRTMLNAAKRMPKLRVVGDQHGCPTNAADLATAILAIIARIDATGWQPGYGGVFHAAGTGEATWFDLALAVFSESARNGGEIPEMECITTADWPTPARRPADSRLDCTRLSEVFAIRLPSWRISLAGVVDDIFAQECVTPDGA
jgi:dTDP-4-dehydrorhamnose reductase